MVAAVIEQYREELHELCRRFEVERLDVFGSALNEEDFDRERSDIDFLVEFKPMEPVRHAKAYFGLLARLEDMFGRPIDLVEIRAVKNPYLLDSVRKTRRQIYAA
jgi:hypothetical protein